MKSFILKPIVFSLFVLLSTQCIYPQSPGLDWVIKQGVGTDEAGWRVLRDFAGNLIVVSIFKGSAQMGGQTYTQLGSDDWDFLVSKFDQSGNHIWTNQYYGTDDVTFPEVKLDGSGNVYLYIPFGADGSVFFGGSVSVSSNVSQADGGMCLAKYNSNGTLAWAVNAASTVGNSGGFRTMDVTSNGDIIFQNWAFEELHINGSSNVYSNTTPPFGKTFTAKFNSSGSYLWHSTLANGPLNPIGIHFSSNGQDAYIAGRLTGTMSFGNNVSLNSTGGNDIYLVKLTAGSFSVALWGGQISSPSNLTVRQMTVDNNNNIYLVGQGSGSVSFGNNVALNLSSEKLFVGKFDNAGQCLWATTVTDSNIFSVRTTSLDNQGNLYLAGDFSDTVTVNGVVHISNGGSDAIITKVGSQGAVIWSKTFGGPFSDYCRADANNDNEIFITGGFESTVDFGGTTLTSAGENDFFLAKYSGCDLPPLNVLSPSGTVLCGSSDSITLELQSIPSNTPLQWLLNGVPISNQTNSQLIVTQAGNYSISTIASACSDTSSVLTVTSSNLIFSINSSSSINSICSGDMITLSTNLPFATYNWSDGTQQNSISVSQPGIYSVTVTDFGGCTAIDSIEITQFPAPSEPDIIIGNDCILACDTTLIQGDYKWRLNGTVVGNNSQFHNARTTGSGFYTIEVEDLNGCVAVSAPVPVSCAVGIKDDDIDFPSVKIITISNGVKLKIEQSHPELQRISFFDNLGREIKSIDADRRLLFQEFEVTFKTAGVYFVVLRVENKKPFIQKFIIN